MSDELVYSPEEWRLVTKLLERERGDLYVEIRHSSIPEAKEWLRDQLKLVESVLDRTTAKLESWDIKAA